MKALKQRNNRSKRKTIIRTTISCIVLFVLIVGGAIAYVWYMGKQQPETTSKVISRPKSTLIQPTQSKPDAVVNASVVMLTTPIQAGGGASITVRTNTLAKCVISVLYNNVPSKDKALIPKNADEFGNVSWTWNIEPAVAAGTYPVRVTCSNTKKSAMVEGKIVVEKQSATATPQSNQTTPIVTN